MKRVELVFFDAGGGHRSAANALQHVIQEKGLPWDVNLMNLQELLDSMDIFKKVTGVRLQDLYNLMLKKGWTLGSAQLLMGMHGVIRLFHGQTVKMLRRYWEGSRPDVVVSLIPNFNRALLQSLERARPGVPLVTILTDMADYPPHFWMERQKQYLICGTDKAVEQAQAMGHAKERVLRASGMILNPRFYELAAVDRVAERRGFGLEADLPTGLLLFGGQGSAVMEKIVRRLDASTVKMQLIAVCGHNARLFEKLRGMQTRFPLHTVGFTKEIPRLMQISDFFIGKPGPGSISEAVHMKLPVIVVRNVWTLPQERYNADWVEEQGVGLVVKSFDREIAPAVGRLLAPGTFNEMLARLNKIENRAVFEIPEMLGRIPG
ncbi:MAG TPA: glycosyltransferase [Bryobacteraceae bacterium]|jgi:1,2-diacylglycerol 3-beta-galactosyltransferase